MILVITTVEGVTGATVSGTEKTDDSCRRVFIETSVLARRDVGLKIIGSGSTTNVEDFELVINCKPVVAGAEDVAGMETSPLVNLS